AREESRESFAKKFGFKCAQTVKEFSANEKIDAVFILGPNKVHFEHFKLALQMPNVKYIYLEKPVCSSQKEEEAMKELLKNADSSIKIQVGFQYLQTSSVREALNFWKSGELGKPIHFDLKYYHGDYLQESYREKRVTRLTPAPDGGAMADLGSHGISLLMAFMGEKLQITSALQGGNFQGVPSGSDLFSSLALIEPETGAVGNMSASRISSGTGDLVYLEIYAEKGAIRYSSQNSEYFEYYLEGSNQWIKQMVGSNYKPVTSFPSGHVPPGWLRSMVHAHYRFFTGDDKQSFNTDLNHGLAVQRIVRETADHLLILEKNIKMAKRSSGVLLHISSLPGNEGIGTLGESAFRFVDFLAENNQKLWQILPLGPVGFGNSPYQCYSAFAGNPLFIDLNLLVNDLLLQDHDLRNKPKFSSRRADFQKIGKWKNPLLRRAFKNFASKSQDGLNVNYSSFLEKNEWWLNDYALFMAAKKYFKNKVWNDWDDEIKRRLEKSLKKLRVELAGEIEYQKFLQFLFFKQWFQLKEYANLKGVKIIGDVPLYVSTDSVDVWANTDIYQLDKNLKPTQVGGVPPDYFSETGQLWGNPVFNWQRLKERDFDWWIARLYFNQNMFDLVRIDHFRGLESFWSVPANEKTAINGEWIPAGGNELMAKFKEQAGGLSFIAEDLGVITPEVEKLRDDFKLPGMKVLQFAFSSDKTNENLPHNYGNNFVVFTGTHDNNTTLGWLRSVKGEEKKLVNIYLGRRKKQALKKSIEMAWSSSAKMAVIPLQDLLGFGSKARMNTPGISSGNWGWRFQWGQLKQKHSKFLKEITNKYNR
ncbi:MAG: 4-alpha-glucanotransferase, partial [Prolixibacteraceae bacterium]|nr:4-alpha-glucanotransferase [Prolixibacteraceae bacterium]